MRLFIAIELSEDIKKILTEIQNNVGDDLAKISWVKQNQMHITLKFLGEVEEGKLVIIQEKLSQVMVAHFQAELDQMGVFPSENYTRVVWVGIKPADNVISLQQEIEASLMGLFKKEERFHPHITLGRVKFVKDKKTFIKKLKSIKIEKKEIKINEFKLIKSILTREGHIYEELANFKLINNNENC